MQMKDFMALYQNLVERCFTSCCNDFTSKALSSKEVRRVFLVLPFS
jgi:import inner membrane translocase subunit TIM9